MNIGILNVGILNPSRVDLLGDGVDLFCDNLLRDGGDLLGDGGDLIGDGVGGHQRRLLHRNVQGQWKFKSITEQRTDGPTD